MKPIRRRNTRTKEKINLKRVRQKHLTKTTEERNKHYTATTKINRIDKEFVLDTVSPITILPPDKNILKSIGIQNITKRYQDKNENENKFRGMEILLRMEYENNKLEMKWLITERTVNATTRNGLDEKI